MYVKCFVVPGSGTALLGTADIDTLGILTINRETIGRQLTPGDNPDKWQRNCQSERAEGGKLESCTNNRQDVDAQKAVQPESGRLESCKNKRQDTDIQKQCSADNKPKSSVMASPMVMGKITNDNNFLSEQINSDNKSFFLELIINGNQSFLSEQFREDELELNVEQKHRKTMKIVKALFQSSLKMLA